MSETTEALNIDGAAAAFGAMLDAPPPEEQEAAESPAVEASEPEAEAPEATEAEAPEVAEQPQTVMVKIDGQEVEVPLDKVIAEYQKGESASKRFEQAAETRKAAEAEIQRTTHERSEAIQKLQVLEAQVLGALEHQAKSVEWDRLLAEDPAEYLKQRHLAEQRQVALQNVRQQSQQLQAVHEAEALQRLQSHLQDQDSLLRDKLIPSWKDEKVAAKERVEVAKFLIDEVGFDPAQVLAQRDASGRFISTGITDARLVALAREAMLYRQTMSKASAAAKKVATLPTKVERPGVAEVNALDKRSAAYQRLAKSGRVEDAASAFKTLL